jgi:hypothetical protein
MNREKKNIYISLLNRTPQYHLPELPGRQIYTPVGFAEPTPDE